MEAVESKEELEIRKEITEEPDREISEEINGERNEETRGQTTSDAASETGSRQAGDAVIGAGVQTAADARGEAKGKISRWTENVKKMGLKLYEVFKEYPLTMGAIIIAAFLGALFLGWDAGQSEEIMEKTALFFLLSSFQVLLLEEVFRHKKVIRILGSIVAAVLSLFCVMILTGERKFILGVRSETVQEIVVRILAAYFILMVGVSIYHMYRRLEDDFAVYAAKAFLEIVKATVVYGLFALGLLILILIFDELIFDTGDFLEQVELFLAAGIYVPMCLKAVSGKNEKPGKFARLCILYVLKPMLLVSFGIIYIYIVKIFVTQSVPNNAIFSILAFLFAIGMPVWTMIHSIRKEDQKEGSQPALEVFLPYVFVPFLILQIWSMGIRIGIYGFTVSRYCAVLLLIAEGLYFVFYLLQHIWKKQAVSWMIFAVIAMAGIGLLAPGLSYDDVVIRSQMKRLTGMMRAERLTEREKTAIGSIYREIVSMGYKGEAAIAEKLSENQIAEIRDYDSGDAWREAIVYLNANCPFTDVDIYGYQRLYEVSYEKLPDGEKIDPHKVQINALQDFDEERAHYVLDMSDFLESVISRYDRKNAYEFSLHGCQIQPIDAARDLYLTDLSLRYYRDTHEIDYLYLDGYVLER
ncbi:MAG: DUF4153 domain-containing protein [Lachnospiraceae bacterium]|nr:DUF4153 domain-containing protein [Lachnospiraceae bacterium]